MKYAIFSDIDGTIYPLENPVIDNIHPQTFKDIIEAQKLGIEFIFATGNGYFENVRKLGKEFNCRYIITSNGATIWDLLNQKIIYNKKISQKMAQEILDFANNKQMTSSWWDDDVAYYNEYKGLKMAEQISKFMTNKKSRIIKMDKIKNDIYKIEFYDKPEVINAMIAFLEKMPLQIAKIDETNIEVTALNVSKGEAVKWLSNHLQFDLNHVMTIGDTSNDISMLKLAKHAYAMANASASAKKYANHHTSSVEQNGLGEAIQDFIYREKIGA